MDEFMMYEYLKSRGMEESKKYDFIEDFKEFMKSRRNSKPLEDDFFYRKPKEELYDKRFKEYNYEDVDRYMRNAMSKEHFTESEAKYTVLKMWHTENGRKYSGEKYDIFKAKEVCDRYSEILPSSVTTYDMYVAINSQYHDYAELFKIWFNDDIDLKIIESTIVFWFRDVDCKSNNKVMKYLG